ncbi:cytochrome-c peroxidase [Desulfoluna spongiiphila]|uniref:cytochrome-c peroxidase n=1 Tax=Desulfoluna spongiiphila TaxID=419481 RepID=UPI000B81CEE7
MEDFIVKKTVLFLMAVGFICFATEALAISNNMERLGMRLFKDKNLSFNGTQSCQNCHHPFAGFADITNANHPARKVVSTGADGVSKGERNAPTAAYAGFSPSLFDDADGRWVGGMFWDGRADGSVLGDPLAEQAQGPPLNPDEMAMPDKEAVIEVIKEASYVFLWYRVFGRDSLDDVDEAYDDFGRAIAAYERSQDVTAFSSKYDVAEETFTPSESRGQALFEANCSGCHSTSASFGSPSALFTNYRYANVGVPANPLVPLDQPDFGLGWTVSDPSQDGKFKIPTLRNIALSAPYSHNGSFSTLKKMVAFINDRSEVTPEVPRNLDQRVGSIGLEEDQIDDIVSFLHTLTDGY